MNKTSSQNIVPILEATFAVVTWGGSFVATKVALQEMAPLSVVWLRFVLGVLVLGTAVLARRQFAVPPTRDLGFFALAGFIGVTLHQWLQSTGMLTAQATTTAWLVATTPIFMVLGGWLFLREPFHWLALTGVTMAAAGVLLVVAGDAPGGLTGIGSLGDLLILLSAPNWALFSLLSKRLMRKYPPALAVFYIMLFGWLFTTVLFVFGPRPIPGAENPLISALGLYSPGLPDLAHLSAGGWAAILVLGILAAGLAYIAWYDALSALPVSQTGSFVYLEPFVTVVVAALVLDEAMTLPAFLGGGLIILGIWLVNRPVNKPVNS